MSYSNELGLIFIVNYPFVSTKPEDDPDGIIKQLYPFDQGFFNYNQYQPHEKVSICYIRCFGSPNSPNTDVTRLKLSEDKKRFIVDTETAFGTVNVGNKDVLSTILTYVVKTSDASRYVMFFYNHSSAFGMFSSNPADSGVTSHFKVNTPPNTAFLKTRSNNFLTVDEFAGADKWRGMVFESAKQPAPKSFGKAKRPQGPKAITREEVSNDFVGNMLTNSELLIALSRAITLNVYEDTPPPKIEILYSAGCYALNIDLAYALSGIVQYLVGAEGIMPPLGYSYTDIVNGLIAELNAKGSSAEMNYEQTICDAMKTFGKAYNLSIPRHQNWLRATYVTALNCSMLPALKVEIDKLSFLLMGAGEDALLGLRQARSKSTDMTTVYFRDYVGLYDIRELLTLFSQAINNHTLKTLCATIIQSLQEIRLPCEYFNEKYLYKNVDCSGMTIYLPYDILGADNREKYQDFYSNLSPTESLFSRDSYWTDLISLFVKYAGLH